MKSLVTTRTCMIFRRTLQSNFTMITNDRTLLSSHPIPLRKATKCNQPDPRAKDKSARPPMISLRQTPTIFSLTPNSRTRTLVRHHWALIRILHPHKSLPQLIQKNIIPVRSPLPLVVVLFRYPRRHKHSPGVLLEHKLYGVSKGISICGGDVPSFRSAMVQGCDMN